MTSYLFTDNVPKKDNMLDTQLNCNTQPNTAKIHSLYTGSTNTSAFEIEHEEEVEGEVARNTDGNLVFLSKIPGVNKLLNEDDESSISDEEQEVTEFKLTGATHLYTSGMTIVGLFILYRLIMKYK